MAGWRRWRNDEAAGAVGGAGTMRADAGAVPAGDDAADGEATPMTLTAGAARRERPDRGWLAIRGIGDRVVAFERTAQRGHQVGEVLVDLGVRRVARSSG